MDSLVASVFYRVMCVYVYVYLNIYIFMCVCYTYYMFACTILHHIVAWDHLGMLVFPNKIGKPHAASRWPGVGFQSLQHLTILWFRDSGIDGMNGISIMERWI